MTGGDCYWTLMFGYCDPTRETRIVRPLLSMHSGQRFMLISTVFLKVQLFALGCITSETVQLLKFNRITDASIEADDKVTVVEV